MRTFFSFSPFLSLPHVIYTLLTLSRILIFSSRLLILFPLFLFMQRYYNYYLLSDGFDTKCCCCCASVYTARKLSQPEKIPKNPQASSPLCPVVLIFQPFFFILFYFISFLFPTVAAVAANDQLMSVREPNGTSNGPQEKRKIQHDVVAMCTGFSIIIIIIIRLCCLINARASLSWRGVAQCA